MSSPDRSIAAERLPLALILAASVATLGGAFLFQYVGGLAPCVLCVYERYPYGAAIALSLVGVFVRDARWRRAILALSALAFLIDAGIGVYHVGVEQHWWEGSAACTGSVSSGKAMTFEAFRQQILSTDVARCDHIPWSLFGVSLAGYNVLISIALALFAACAARTTLNERSR
ncbi:MAG TPA: disulfide bond formation protein B [Alphaproteobacteria bacterium]